MKKYIFILLLLSINLNAQTGQFEKVSNEACGCIEKIKTDIKDKKKFKQVKECITTANTTIQLLEGLGINKSLDSLENNPVDIDSVLVGGDRDIIIDVDKDYKKIEEHLLRNCEPMKTLMNSHDLKRRKSVSNKKTPKEHYDKGQVFFSQGKYAIAIEHYKNAVNEDPKFAFAWDI